MKLQGQTPLRLSPQVNLKSSSKIVTPATNKTPGTQKPKSDQVNIDFSQSQTVTGSPGAKNQTKASAEPRLPEKNDPQSQASADSEQLSEAQINRLLGNLPPTNSVRQNSSTGTLTVLTDEAPSPLNLSPSKPVSDDSVASTNSPALQRLRAEAENRQVKRAGQPNLYELRNRNQAWSDSFK